MTTQYLTNGGTMRITIEIDDSDPAHRSTYDDNIVKQTLRVALPAIKAETNGYEYGDLANAITSTANNMVEAAISSYCTVLDKRLDARAQNSEALNA